MSVIPAIFEFSTKVTIEKKNYLDYVCFDVFLRGHHQCDVILKFHPYRFSHSKKYASLNMGMNLAMAEPTTHIGPNDIIISFQNI